MLEKASSEKILELLEISIKEGEIVEDRNRLWKKINRYLLRHKKTLKNKEIMKKRLEKIEKLLSDNNPVYMYQSLFDENDIYLYDENEEFDKKRESLESRRQMAVKFIIKNYDVKGLLDFIRKVENPFKLGKNFGNIEDINFDSKLLPEYLDTTEQKISIFMQGYIKTKYFRVGQDWIDNLEVKNWSINTISNFLCQFPFTLDIWIKVEELFEKAIDKLIKYKRPHGAIKCMAKLLHSKEKINEKQAVIALLSTGKSIEEKYKIDIYNIQELIKKLQNDQNVRKKDLMDIEWGYISILDEYSGSKPMTLEYELANNPNFYCEIIKNLYLSDKKNIKERNRNESAINAMDTLLFNWKTPPGLDKDNKIDKDVLNSWIREVEKISKETGHFDIAMEKVGEVFAYAPEDVSGLWIDKSIVEILNKKEYKKMNEGYQLGIYNKRGVRTIDPEGKPEFELEKLYEERAEEMENLGYIRFATCLRNISKRYKREAERIIDKYM